MAKQIFHVDANSAFLSWEATRRVAQGEPDIRLIPSAISGDPERRTGVILAKSIPAKKFGSGDTSCPMASGSSMSGVRHPQPYAGDLAADRYGRLAQSQV